MTLKKYDYFKYLMLVYLLRRGTLGDGRSWSDPAVVDLSGLTDPPGEGSYPLDFSKDDVPELLTDQAGIPMIDYANLGIHCNPWFVGHIALGRFTKWHRTQSGEYKNGFLRLADWFVNNATFSASGARWYYHFDWFNHPSPWFSGLSQAHAISVLIRAACLSGDHTYAELAESAMQAMTAPLVKGGTATQEPDGTLCFQESMSSSPSYILNGHLFSCIAAYEASQFFAKAEYASAAERGFLFVKNRVHDFDLGYWSRYSLKVKAGLPDIASGHYHDVHIAQLLAAHALTGDKQLLDTAQQFRAYQRNPTCSRKALWLKRLVKILA